jgi:hypothetical protein
MLFIDVRKVFDFKHGYILIILHYPQELALTSPTSGGRLVGIVRWRTKATELKKMQLTPWS